MTKERALKNLRRRQTRNPQNEYVMIKEKGQYHIYLKDFYSVLLKNKVIGIHQVIA